MAKHTRIHSEDLEEEHSHGDKEDEELSDEELLAEALEIHVKAGLIARKVRKYAEELVKKERSLLEIAEKIEAKTEEEGGGIAFPCNLSFNDDAAHYTPSAGDKTLIEDGKHLLKVDFGVHVDGYIIDQAFTVDYTGEQGKLVEATAEALQNALSIMKAGVSTREVGAEIEKTITDYGFKPVENLCGHSLMQYSLHAGIEVPNVGNRGDHVFEEGEAFAVEPFASTGKGYITEGEVCQIYSMDVESQAPIRLPRSRQLIGEIAKKSATMPFALRWFKDFPMLNLALADLVRQGVVQRYPVLQEQRGSWVSQAEASVIIEKDGVKLL